MNYNLDVETHYAPSESGSVRSPPPPPPPPPSTPASHNWYSDSGNDGDITNQSRDTYPVFSPTLPTIYRQRILPSNPTRQTAYPRPPEHGTFVPSFIRRNDGTAGLTAALDELPSRTSTRFNNLQCSHLPYHTAPAFLDKYPGIEEYGEMLDSGEDIGNARIWDRAPCQSPPPFDSGGVTASLGEMATAQEYGEDNVSVQSDDSNGTVVHNTPASPGPQSDSSADSSISSIFDTPLNAPMEPSRSSLQSEGSQFMTPVLGDLPYGASSSLPSMPVGDLRREKFTIGQRSQSASPQP